MLYIVIFLGLLGALGWLIAVRPLIRARLDDLDDNGITQANGRMAPSLDALIWGRHTSSDRLRACRRRRLR